MHVDILEDVVVIVSIGAVMATLLSRFRLPTAAGLLLTGALIGPYGFSLLKSADSIQLLAEVGVILLLFAIGLEFSLKQIAVMARQVALGGFLQVLLTVLGTVGVAMAVGASLEKALFFGFVVSLSSTAIVLRDLSDRGEIDAPHGRFVVGVMVFQDLCVVPMMLLIPLLAHQGKADGAGVWSFLPALLGSLAFVVAFFVVARFLLPRLLASIDRTRSRDVFLMAVLGLCFGIAWLTSQMGLSLALGAFMGGMAIADTRYHHRASGLILPLRDIFMSIFFVSLGMLFDGRAVLGRPGVVALLVLGFVFGKAILATLAAMVIGIPARVAWLAGVSLSQFGEFGFVLATVAEGAGLVSSPEIRELMCAGIISMFLTPLTMRLAPALSTGAKILEPLEKLLGVKGVAKLEEHGEKLADHVVLVGFGLGGKEISGALTQLGLPYVVLELNAETVKRASADGVPIYYADITTPETLKLAHVETARAVAILINDPQAAKRAIGTIRRLAPEVPILLRTPYLMYRDELRSLGATELVFEDLEGAVEMLTRVLRCFGTPRNVIADQVALVRDRTHRSDRTFAIPRRRLGEERDLDEMKIEKVLITRESHARGKDLLTLDVQKRTGALVVAIAAPDQPPDQPRPDQPLEEGYRVYLVGPTESIAKACTLLSSGQSA